MNGIHIALLLSLCNVNGDLKKKNKTNNADVRRVSNLIILIYIRFKKNGRLKKSIYFCYCINIVENIHNLRERLVFQN